MAVLTGKETKRYPNWDILRLLAALTVVQIHWLAHFWGLPLHTRILMDPVPCFVCLSGVLIPESFANSASYGHFAWKRILRVYPAFFLSLLIAVCLFGSAVLGPTLAVYLTMGIVILPGAVNGVLWSLSLEEVLYAAHVLTRIRNFFNPWSIWGCFLACAAGWWFFRVGHGSDIFRTAASFFAGNLAYLNMKRLGRIPGWWFFAGATALHYGLPIAMYHGMAYLHVQAKGISNPSVFINAPLSSLCLVMGFRNIPQIKWKFPDLSYGIYIYHAMLLQYEQTLFGFTANRALAVVLVGTFALAAASWYLLEKPALSRKNKLPSFKRFRTERKIDPLPPIELELEPELQEIPVQV